MWFYARSVSCKPDMIASGNYQQLISCDVVDADGRNRSGEHPPHTEEYRTTANAFYDCPYGGGMQYAPLLGMLGLDGVSNNTCIIKSTEIIPSKNLGNNTICQAVGNPVHPRTGNKSAIDSDYNSPSIKFTRYYNSQQNKLDRHIGIQWRHSYTEKLKFGQNDTTSAVFAERSDGGILFFKLENNLWVSDDDISDELLQLTDDTWKLVIADDTIERYDTTGKLLSISSRDGRTQTLAYDTNGRLTSVVDDVGHALSFTYDGSSRMQTMTDPAGGIFQYAYDSVGNLTSVTYPDGKVRTYHYNEPAYTSGANLPNALTGITDENGIRFATYTYDAQGRAVVTEHAGGVERYVLGYSTDGSHTLVTDPLGSQYTHNFQTILGVAKSTGQSQPAGSGCSAASSHISYDANGNAISRADFNGNKTCYAYDLNRNLEIARVEGVSSASSCPGDLLGYTLAANSSERKILTEWHVNYRLPVKITEAGRETSFVYDTYGNVTHHQIKDTVTNDVRAWNTHYAYHPSITGVILQKTEDGPRTDVTDITITDYYPPDAACSGGHFGCRGQIAGIANALGHVTQITRYSAHGQAE